MRLVLAFAATAALFAAWGVVNTQSATATQSVVYRYAIHYPMTKASDARLTTGWLVRNGFDVAGINAGKQEIEVITDDLGLQLLARNHYAGRIVDQHIDGKNAAPDKRYLNPEKVNAKLEELVAKYPTLTRMEKVGSSNQNRPVMAILVSTTPGKDDPAAMQKPSIIFDGMHHAREIMTAEIVMDVAEHLLEGYAAGNDEAKKLLDTWNVWVLPMLNVDGNNIVWTTNNMWRKNAAAASGRVHGVDINRNYPYKWMACNGSSGSRSAEDYRGLSPGSEPETHALMAMAEMAHPAASLSYHSYSELVLYPYGCDDTNSSEAALLTKVGKELSMLLPGDSGGFYEPGTPWKILYAVDGDSMDWIHSQFGALTYTFEVNQSFQPRWEVRQPTIEKQRKAWKYFMNRASGNMLKLKVMDTITGTAVPTPAEISINTIPHSQQEKPFATNSGGVFFKVLDPGAYVVTVKLIDGRKQDVAVTMGGQAQAMTVEVK